MKATQTGVEGEKSQAEKAAQKAHNKAVKKAAKAGAAWDNQFTDVPVPVEPPHEPGADVPGKPRI